MFVLYFLKLTLAHLLVRFAVEPYLVPPDAPGDSATFFRSLVVGCAKSAVAALLLSPEFHVHMLVTLGVFALCGAVIDSLDRWSSRPAWMRFVAAQSGYVVLCTGTGLWWSAAGDLAVIVTALSAVPGDRRLLWISTVYFATVFWGGALVREIAAHFSQQLSQDTKAKKPGLPNAGKYIGWLERFLIVTFVLGGFGDAIGFLLAAKALVRYPEIIDPNGIHAEYFLIGTLTSVGLALLGGFVLQWAVG